MEDQPEPPASTFPPSGIFFQTSITAQNSAENIVPQVIGCHIGGSLNITVGTSTPANAQHQQASARGSNTGSRISERVTERLKCRLKRKFDMIFEGLAKRGKPALLRDIYTELYITEGESGGLNKEHEVWQIDTAFKTPSEQDIPISCNDIFRPLNIQNSEGKNREDENNVQRDDAQKRPPRTVVTKGIAGIGKTVSVQKFILDWAERKANQDIDLLLVLPFRELNSIKDEKLSLHELLLNFHCELREFENPKYYEESKILFIFDGLDESKLPFDFGQGPVSDVSKPASLDELMTNLITGNLLPSALIWITSRPAAIKEIPPHLVHRMTEVRGFTDSQKEEYFRKKISNQSLASRIISHVKGSRTLEIMCHIPVFCWITAMVLEQMLKGSDEKIPSSLTELYTRFLLIQTSEKKKKYHGTKETDPRNLSEEDVQLILKLGKLAFDNLQKRNIVFSEDDLQKYGIDITEASLRSGMFTEILKQEDPMFSEKMYSFVHLSFQEYLAALYVLHTFAHKGENLMQNIDKKHCALYGNDLYSDRNVVSQEKVLQQEMPLYDLQKCAIHKALRCRSGHLDLFLRFFLGLSLESNQKLLRSFSLNVESRQRSILQTVQYLKNKLSLNGLICPSTKQCINLFHCLLELNDHSVAEEIQSFLTSDRQAENNLMATQCSTLAYIILMSGEVLEELDIKKYSKFDQGCRRLIPAIRNCRKAVLKCCHLCKNSCEDLASALQSVNSRLKVLHLNYNHLSDTGVQKIFQSLRYSVLENFRFIGSHMSGVSFETLCCFLTDSQLKELDLGSSLIGDDGLNKICIALQMKPMLTILGLSDCSLTAGSCEVLASALSSESLALRELDLSNNDLEDSGLKLLSTGLQSPHCKLEILRLSGCMISEKGCSALASALTSNPSHLKELDLSYNHPGESGKRLLSAKLEDPHCRLETLDVTHGGEHRMTPGLKKYACYLQNLSVTRRNTREWERFLEDFPGLSEGRFYWQFEIKGHVQIRINYKGEECNKERTLHCSDRRIVMYHFGTIQLLASFTEDRKQLGVYLDHPAGRLSFYKISSDKILHKHTIQHKFQKPLYPCIILDHMGDEDSVQFQAL